MIFDTKGIVVAAAVLALAACESDGIDIGDFEVEDGYALSAGTSTLFLQSSVAYDTDAAWVASSSELSRRFNRGDQLYDNGYVPANGLGPVYAGYSCGFCHQNAGRTTPSFAADEGGGSPSTGYSTMLIYITRKNGTFFPNYGRVVHDHGIYEENVGRDLSFGGVHAEGKLHVSWEFADFAMPDGEPYQLRRPHYRITDWYADSIRPEDLFITVRVPLRHVGMGQMMSLDQSEIEALARKSNYPEWGINGRCNYITERGRRQLGVSGNKAQHADLTVELGFSSDMGVTNSRYPEEICEGQLQMQEGSMMGLLYDQLDVSTAEMEDVDMYLHGLGVPAREVGRQREPHHDRARVDCPGRAHVRPGRMSPLPRHDAPHPSPRRHAAQRHTAAVARLADHTPVLRLPAPRHGQRDDGRGPQRQLRQRTRPRQRLAHHTALGRGPAEEGQRPPVLPPRRPRTRLHGGHPVARRRG